MRTATLAPLAAALAGMAFFNLRAARGAERRNPPRGRFVEVEGQRLHVLEQGDGPTILLLHGAFFGASDWVHAGIMDGLAERGRVLAFDRPGYGWSPRPRNRRCRAEDQAALIAAALDALDAWPAAVIGHSYGATVALALALARPRQVHGLALLSGYYDPVLRADSMLYAPASVPLIGDAIAATLLPTTTRLSWSVIERRLFEPAPVSESFRAEPLDLTFRPSQMRASAQDISGLPAAARRLAQPAGDVSAPILLLAGDGDRIIDPE